MTSPSRHKTHLYGPDGLDTESVRDGKIFNPKYYGLSRFAAQTETHLHASEANDVEPEFRIHRRDLFEWQRFVVDMFKDREDPKFGRCMYWFWEFVFLF
jgi:hypothetical protein